MDEFVALPTNGRSERQEILSWMAEEQQYAHEKFNFDSDDYRDKDLQKYDIDAFWWPRITQYVDRCRVFMNGALEASMEQTLDAQERARKFEMMAQQQMAKVIMTAKDAAESMIRVYGGMPRPGVSSGIIELWNPICTNCGNPVDIEREAWQREVGHMAYRHEVCN